MNIILVNEQDEVLGEIDKIEAHKGEGFLHRAFTVIILDKENKVLSQRRSEYKTLWPLKWEAGCSSHQLLGEDDRLSAQERLSKEMGFSCTLDYIGKFHYSSAWDGKCSEREICYLLVGYYDNEPIKPNKQEVAEYQWIEPDKLKQQIQANPDDYVPWLSLALDLWQQYEQEHKP